MAMPLREPLRKPCGYCGKEMLLGGRGRPKEATKYCSRRCLGYGRTIQPTIAILSSEEACYMAGLFDGEGSVITYIGPGEYHGRLRLRCSIANTHLGVLEWCREVTGTGTIVTKKPWSKPEQMHWLPSYVWQCYSRNAVSLLEQMMPWLIIKRARAIEGIESQEVHRAA